MKKLLSLLLFFVAIQLKAQTDPVQVTAQLLPPYSLIVSEYYAGTTPKINLLLLNRDLARPTITVRLRMTIESQSVKLRTKDLPATTLATFTLTAGVPVYVSNTDLTQYFNAANLDFNGISASEYQQSGKLPEGFYTFCFEAIEVQSSIAVSRSSCAFAWMTLSDPPLLNIPSCGEEVAPINPQNIVFNWTPRHMAAPNAAFLMEYQFSITEINDALPSPESAFYSGTPLYTGTTAATTFLYGPSMPQLQANKRYAWRVRAVAKQGGVEQAMFKNNGYSQVCWFTYRSNCDPVIGISTTVQGTRATIEWQANTKHLEYKVQYRMVADSLGEWFTTSNTIPRVAIYDLKASKQYEYRVGASCEYGFFNYSEKKYFTTGDSSQTFVASCGVDGTPTLVPASSLLATMNIPDTIRAGDFTIHVTYVTSGGPGNFSGKGYTSVPWLAGVKVGVEFTSITVNSDRKLTAGVIKTTYDPQWGGIFDVDGFLDGGGETGHVVTGLVTTDYKPNVTITNPNQVVVTSGTNGSSTITINTPGGSATYTAPSLPATIQDNQGNIYTVNKDGTVSQSAQNGGQGTIAKMNPKQLDGSQGKVEFMPPADAGKMTYAFDAWKDVYAKSTAFASKYERINGGSTPYYVAAKAIAPGKPDIIRAKITLATGSGLIADSVKFISGKGVIFTKTATSTPGEYEVNIVGGPANDAQEIYACYKKTDTTLNLGKLLVSGYGEHSFNVVLVPVNGATGFSRQKIEDSLNVTYKPLNIKFNVRQADNFVNDSWDTDHNGLNVSGSNAISVLTPEMKALNKAFSKTAAYVKGDIYLFVLNHASDSTILGDMPRAKQFGYLFTDNNNHIERTAGHEIGHGIFRLKHMSEQGFLLADLPGNVMNYPAGREFYKFQWDVMHDPPFVLGIFESDEDGQEAIVNNIEELSPFKNTDGSYTFLSVAGKPITLKGNLTQVGFVTAEDQWQISKNFFPLGVLCSFEIDGKKYSARKTSGTMDFAGYRNMLLPATTIEYYTDTWSHAKNYTNVLVGLTCIKEGNTVFQVFPTNYLAENPTQQDVALQNKGEGPELPTYFLGTYLSRQSEGKSLYAQMPSPKDEEIFFLNEYSPDGNLCGLDALYAFKSAYLIRNNPGLLGCLKDAELDANATIHKGISNEMSMLNADRAPSDNTRTVVSKAAESDSYNTEYTKRFSTKNFQQNFNSVLENYKKVIDDHSTSFGSLTTAEMGDIIEFFDIAQARGRMCLLRNIPFALRTEILNKRATWTMTTSKESLLIDLIESTPDADVQKMIDYLKDDNYANLWRLNDEINQSNIDRFATVVSYLVLQKPTNKAFLEHWPAEAAGYDVPPPTSMVTPFLYVSKEEQYLNTSTNSFVNYSSGAIWRTNTSITLFFSSSSDMADKYGKKIYTREYTGNPFELVRVKFKTDFRFQQFGDNQPIKEGDDVIVPIYWVYWLHKRQQTVENWAFVRLVGDAAAVVAAVVTVNPSPLLILDAAVGAVDITFTIAEDYIESSGSPLSKQVYELWNNFYTTYGIIRVGQGIYNLDRAKILAKGKELYNTNKERFQQFSDHLHGLVKSIQNFKPATITNAGLRNFAYTTVLNTYLNFKIATFTKVSTVGAELFVKSSKIIAKSGSYEVSIMDVLTEADGSLLLTNVRWYTKSRGEVSEIMALFKAGEYRYIKYQQKIIGDIQVVKLTNGQFYARVVPLEISLSNFVAKNLTQKIEYLETAWSYAYPQLLFERKLLEDIVGHYRYNKSGGWGHTSDISDNFKTIDFYDNFTTAGDDIFSNTAVSMKTTTTESVDAWLGTSAVRSNIDNLKNAVGSGAGKGVSWNGKTIFYNKAEIHIYMPKENITPALKTEWLSKLATEHPTIKFEIKSLEEVIK